MLAHGSACCCRRCHCPCSICSLARRYIACCNRSAICICTTQNTSIRCLIRTISPLSRTGNGLIGFASGHSMFTYGCRRSTSYSVSCILSTASRSIRVKCRGHLPRCTISLAGYDILRSHLCAILVDASKIRTISKLHVTVFINRLVRCRVHKSRCFITGYLVALFEAPCTLTPCSIRSVLRIHICHLATICIHARKCCLAIIK